MTHEPRHPRCRHDAYHMTCEQFDDLLAKSAGRCMACGSTAELFMDHDHALGFKAVRGLVCSSCNSLLTFADAGQPGQPGELLAYLLLAWHKTAGITDYGCPTDPCRYTAHKHGRRWAAALLKSPERISSKEPVYYPEDLGLQGEQR